MNTKINKKYCVDDYIKHLYKNCEKYYDCYKINFNIHDYNHFNYILDYTYNRETGTMYARRIIEHIIAKVDIDTLKLLIENNRLLENNNLLHVTEYNKNNHYEMEYEDFKEKYNILIDYEKFLDYLYKIRFCKSKEDEIKLLEFIYDSPLSDKYDIGIILEQINAEDIYDAIYQIKSGIVKENIVKCFGTTKGLISIGVISYSKTHKFIHNKTDIEDRLIFLKPKKNIKSARSNIEDV